MSIKSLLGGEINYKAIDKHYQKEYKKLVEKQKFNDGIDKTFFSLINKIGFESFIKDILNNSKDYETASTSSWCNSSSI